MVVLSLAAATMTGVVGTPVLAQERGSIDLGDHCTRVVREHPGGGRVARSEPDWPHHDPLLSAMVLTRIDSARARPFRWWRRDTGPEAGHRRYHLVMTITPTVLGRGPWLVG